MTLFELVHANVDLATEMESRPEEKIPRDLEAEETFRINREARVISRRW